MSKNFEGAILILLKLIQQNSDKVVFDIPFEKFQWNTLVIYLNLVPRGFLFSKRGQQQKTLPL